MTVQVLAAIVIGFWKASQLARTPKRISLWWVVACFALSAAAFAVAPYAGAGVEGGVSGTGPIWLMWLGEALLLTMLYSLICVFVFSAGQGRAAWWQAVREVVRLGITLVVLGVLAATVPQRLAPAEYPRATLDAFRFVANTYTVYGVITCIVWMRRHAKITQRWLARGLVVASAGLALIGLGSTLIAVSMVIRLANPDTSIALELPNAVVMVANLLVLIGFVLPGARVRWVAGRVWWRHLRDYHRLRPLWTMLHEAFPEDALSRAPASPWRDTLSLRAVNRRFYRRVIECRDGLVRASGRLPAGTPTDPAAIAAWLRDALRTTPSEDDIVAAHPIAVPADGGLEADVRELVALARELRV
ncbi:MAB_1171c family putative transporter [Kutzneria chonburiensis]|uniref:MAB_1171c family putative transporter n=1 Tax=Kutzneria chonburiensis TaxID=1483604 RepID=A0ABV6N9Q6_9PSEU|nr:MAB_1171c family putative transporter [Kutzneria chonburiensis]